MAKLFFGTATLVGAIAFVACSDDAGSSIENDAKSTVDTLESLPDCTRKNDAEVATIKDSAAVFVCKDGNWDILDTDFVANDSAETLDDIPNCADEQDGNSYYIEEFGVNYVCENERWEIVTVDEKAVKSSSSEQASTSTDKSSASSKSSSSKVSSSSSKGNVSDTEPESSSSKTKSSSSVTDSSSSAKSSSSMVTSSSSIKVSSSSAAETSSSAKISSSSAVESSSSIDEISSSEQSSSSGKGPVSSSVESSFSAEEISSSEQSSSSGKELVSSSVESCSSAEESSSSNIAVTKDDLPNCAEIYEGSIFYVESETAYFICGEDRKWGKTEDCGTETVNTNLQFCEGDVVYNIADYCNSATFANQYSLTDYYCDGTTAYLKSEYGLCGTAYYNISTHFCVNDTIHELCGGEEYDLSTHFCVRDTLYELCGGSTYTPRYEGYCVDNSFYRFRMSTDNRTTHTYFEDPRDHQLYRFGSVGIYSQLYQLWMLQNLNYKMTHSLCYAEDNINYSDNANCNTYGRLYRFSEAYRACPPGWHLPTDKEFKAYPYYIDNGSGYEAKLDTSLTGEADTSDIAGKFLKANTSLWEPYDGIEVDDRGEFYALPGGRADVNRSTSLPTFYQLGKTAYFWTSTYDSPYETGAYGTKGNAMALILRYDSDKAVFREFDVYEAFSVRCVRVEN